MKKKSNSDRRSFIKSMGVLGLAGATVPMAQSCSSSENKNRNEGVITIPTRPLGNTGINVPVIAVGLGSMDRFFKEAYLKYGLTYWDTSIRYGEGKTESGLGAYFASNPNDAKKEYTYKWYNPSTGEWTEPSTIQGDSLLLFRCPELYPQFQEFKDWVLYIYR